MQDMFEQKPHLRELFQACVADGAMEVDDFVASFCAAKVEEEANAVEQLDTMQQGEHPRELNTQPKRPRTKAQRVAEDKAAKERDEALSSMSSKDRRKFLRQEQAEKQREQVLADRTSKCKCCWESWVAGATGGAEVLELPCCQDWVHRKCLSRYQAVPSQANACPAKGCSLAGEMVVVPLDQVKAAIARKQKMDQEEDDQEAERARQNRADRKQQGQQLAAAMRCAARCRTGIAT